MEYRYDSDNPNCWGPFQLEIDDVPISNKLEVSSTDSWDDFMSKTINDIPKNTKINHERIKPWGTAHAVWSARNVIKSSFVIINADDYYGKEAFQQAAYIWAFYTQHQT